MALGTGILLAPGANAADKWGPGYLIPDSTGKPDRSHIGAYGPPGQALPGVTGVAYCADPELDGPEAAGRYGPVKEYTSWTSKATGKEASAQDIARAAYVLSKYGNTTDDAQAAAVDAVVYSYLEAGTTYALPNGERALQRLSYPGVAPSAKKQATEYMAEAAKFAGPYKVNIKPSEGTPKPGAKTTVTLDVTSAAGHKVPGVKLDLGLTGAGTSETTATTNAEGIATTTITPAKAGTATLKATAESLPGNALRAITPSNAKAQRMVLTGGTTSAHHQVQFQVDPLKGGIKIVKTAVDTGKTLAGVAFEIKDGQGKTAAAGKTDAAGVWQVKDLAPGSYTVHEVKAVEGYQLAPDQTVTVGADKTADIAVKDVKIPEPEKPKPRPVTIPVLPKTGL
ncbi:MSCRAMM family protein [Streptomyces yaizuensis]|uniref:Carboxypeptidase regulatory-like domain-containing protein n=1 Tax=Streptomyces yaizuensis TaxID=2989713 RepID=A0ABQ5P689_9ACTN|nr:SpaA isopeptide-forming pilin-related protein [Streptomyces sp. YSPA8]GLF98077.1 carboxypeptidase regulatory-like domain-containing protein [Streptomyces sp. YSPA8]